MNPTYEAIEIRSNMPTNLFFKTAREIVFRAEVISAVHPTDRPYDKSFVMDENNK